MIQSWWLQRIDDGVYYNLVLVLNVVNVMHAAARTGTSRRERPTRKSVPFYYGSSPTPSLPVSWTRSHLPLARHPGPPGCRRPPAARAPAPGAGAVCGAARAWGSASASATGSFTVRPSHDASASASGAAAGGPAESRWQPEPEGELRVLESLSLAVPLAVQLRNLKTRLCIKHSF